VGHANSAALSGFCYFIHTNTTCPSGSPNPPSPGAPRGSYYGPYFVSGWTTGQPATTTTAATSTFYYTLDTFSPYGQVILKSTIKWGSPLPLPSKSVPPCKGTKCM
jgi:hypothetical protein